MGGLCRIVDSFLFVYFIFISVTSVILDAQICIPAKFFPDPLFELTSWVSREFDHYLLAEKPNFYAGVGWVVLIVHWPAAVASVYGFIAKKSWISMTCLIYGVSNLSCLIVIFTEMIKSKRASEKMFMLYLPFLGVAVLAVLRGLIPCSGGGSAASARISAAPRKKRT